MIAIGAAAAKDWSFPAFFSDGRFKVAVAVAAGLAVAWQIGRLGGQGREPQLVYILADAGAEAEVSARVSAKAAAAVSGGTASGTGVDRGTAIKDELKSIQSEALASTSCLELRRGNPDRRALIELAYATGLIKDTQRLWSFWWYGFGEAKDSRYRRFNVVSETVDDRPKELDGDAVRDGVVGATEVADAMREFRTRDFRIRASRQRIERRYGKGAPWGSEKIINFRIEFLTAVGWRPA